MASPTAARRSARTTAASDDALDIRMAEWVEWGRKNARAILIGAVVALVAVGGFLAYRMSAASRAARASEAFLEVQQSLATVDSAAAATSLQNFIRRYDGSVEADEARLELGQRRMAAGQVKQAIPLFREVSDGGSPLAFQGTTLLAAAQARDGQAAQAVQTYMRAADDAELAFQEQEALSEAALLHEAAGNFGEAAKVYGRMLENTETGTLERSIIELRVAEAEARASAPAPAERP